MKPKLLIFFLGLVSGVLGTIFVPRLVSPMLPAGLKAEAESVDGTVVRRQRDPERLLLTINTPEGAALATFTEKVAEIDLLVAEGDSVTLDASSSTEFVDNPPIIAVRKVDFGAEPAAIESATDPVSEEAQSVVPEEQPVEAPTAELEQWPEDADPPPGN